MRRFALLLAVAAVVTACGDDSEPRDAAPAISTTVPAATSAPTTTVPPVTCEAVEVAVEPTVGHVIGDGSTATYEFHPPTGGLHVGQGPAPGVLDAPVPEPDQVGGLEFGKVFLQYTAGADPAAVAVLVDAAAQRGLVVVAPAVGEIDGGYPIAFTAWDHRQLCTNPALEDALAFIDAHAGNGPEH